MENTPDAVPAWAGWTSAVMYGYRMWVMDVVVLCILASDTNQYRDSNRTNIINIRKKKKAELDAY